MSNCFQLITKTLIMIISGSREKKDAAEVQFLFRVVWVSLLPWDISKKSAFAVSAAPFLLMAS